MFGLSKKRPIEMAKLAGEPLTAGDLSSKGFAGLAETDTVDSAVRLILSGQRIIPVLDGKGERVKGVLTSKEVLSHISSGGSLNVRATRLMKPSLGLDAEHSLQAAVRSFREHGSDMRHVEKDGVLYGVLTESDLARRVDRRTGLKVQDVMTEGVFSISDDDSLRDVAKMLSVGPYRKLPVTRGGLLVGIVTPHDIIRHLHSRGRLHNIRKSTEKIGYVMNPFVLSVSPRADLSEAVHLMREKDLSGLPVTDRGFLVGMITEKDIIDAMV